LSDASQGARPGPSRVVREPATAGLSPAEALTSAFSDTLRLLFSPFDLRRWIKLSIVCLFLGGGTSSAAFHWSLGSLPSEVGVRDVLIQGRAYLAQHLWLIVLAIALGLGLGLSVLYLRALFRFVLVDTIVKREILVRQAISEFRPLAHSYFFWLLGALLVAGTVLAAGVLAVLPHLRTTPAAGRGSLVFTAALATILLAEVFAGLIVALVIMLTDDLAVPVMYAEGLRLLAAWRKLWRYARGESGSFALYVLLRFVVSVGVGVAVLFFLFPVLVALFSGAIILGALVVLALRLVGIAWVWNLLTLVLASLALLLLMGLLLVLLSLAGMPGQVFLQNFGMRFIAPRVPSLSALWRLPHPTGWRR